MIIGPMAFTDLIQFHSNEYTCSSYAEVRYTRIIPLKAICPVLLLSTSIIAQDRISLEEWGEKMPPERNTSFSCG